MYACQICNKAFPRKNALDRHVFIHSELKNFVCELYSLAFKSNNNLRHHCAVHHENRHYKCKYCYRRFRSSDGRKYHYLKEHNDQIESLGFKLYPCTYCDHISATYQLSVQHLSIHVDNKVLVCSICQRQLPILISIEENLILTRRNFIVATSVTLVFFLSTNLRCIYPVTNTKKIVALLDFT
jgi:KRAB domain-containing zinc finger protein